MWKRLASGVRGKRVLVLQALGPARCITRLGVCGTPDGEVARVVAVPQEDVCAWRGRFVRIGRLPALW